jgi:hypothetical protein
VDSLELWTTPAADPLLLGQNATRQAGNRPGAEESRAQEAAGVFAPAEPDDPEPDDPEPDDFEPDDFVPPPDPEDPEPDDPEPEPDDFEPVPDPDESDEPELPFDDGVLDDESLDADVSAFLPDSPAAAFSALTAPARESLR